MLNQAIARRGRPAQLDHLHGRADHRERPGADAAPDIRLLVVTGGRAVVKEAMHSGKKAICAGPGNPPAVVDETADIEQAAMDLVKGASFDNNVVCTR